MHGSRAFFIAVAVSAAFLAVWSCPVEGAKPGEIEQTRFLAIEFEDVPLPTSAESKKLTPKTLPAYAASISGVDDAKSEGTPALVYFYVQEMEIVPDELKKVNTKQQVKRCAKLEEKCFMGKDVGIGTLAKLFVCIKVDVSCVLPGKNRMFNVFKAPLVLIVPPGGGMVDLISGNKMNKSGIMSGMTKVLQRKKVDVQKVLKNTKAILPRIRKIEGNKSELNRALQETQKKRNAAMLAENFAKAAKYRKKQKELLAESKKLKKKLSAVYEEFDAALGKPKAP